MLSESIEFSQLKDCVVLLLQDLDSKNSAHKFKAGQIRVAFGHLGDNLSLAANDAIQGDKPLLTFGSIRDILSMQTIDSQNAACTLKDLIQRPVGNTPALFRPTSKAWAKFTAILDEKNISLDAKVNPILKPVSLSVTVQMSQK